MAEAADDVQVREKFRQLETLLNAAEKSGNAQMRDGVKEVVQLLMEVHGLGLERMLEQMADAGTAGHALIDTLATDPLVSSLLLLYGLHPVDLETRVHRALDKARPTLAAHGGNVELLGLTDGVVRLRLLGGCHGCPSSSITLRQTIDEAVLEFAPDAAGIEVLGEDMTPADVFESAPPADAPPAGRFALPILSR